MRLIAPSRRSKSVSIFADNVADPEARSLD
jgi:hypothetical protein